MRRRLHGWRVYEDVMTVRSTCNASLRAILAVPPKPPKAMSERTILAKLKEIQSRPEGPLPKRHAATAVSRVLGIGIERVERCYSRLPSALKGKRGRPRKN